MGLDIYAGTLTRYYSHNWKTVVQQWAEENGYSFNRITPDGEPADNEEEMSPAEVQAAVENWRDQILSAISQPGQPPYAPWLEDNEKPYYTDKPDWDAFGAMLLVAACRTYEEPVPSTVEKDWIFGEHPLVARLASDEERVWSLFRGATWWLPLSDSFLFQGSLPTDDTAAIATLGGLRKELEKLNQLAWQADEDTILGWADTEGYPTCEAFYFQNCGKLFLAEDVRSHQIEGPDRFIRFGVNVRFFNIEGTEDMLIDTVGMSTLFLPDLQYHFHGMDPNWVVNHAYNAASYILEHDNPIEDGETIDGVADGQMCREIQWKCQYEDALIQPPRGVLDINMGNYASGGR